MSWTKITRVDHDRSDLRYASDCHDEEWRLIAPVVLPCTLLAYDPVFEMGNTLAEAANASGGMFDHGEVKLCPPHCAKFCVLGGATCSSAPG